MKILLLVALCIGLASCVPDTDHVMNENGYVCGGGGCASVVEFDLKDSKTHCAALVGYNKSAISCGWKQDR